MYSFNDRRTIIAMYVASLEAVELVSREGAGLIFPLLHALNKTTYLS